MTFEIELEFIDELMNLKKNHEVDVIKAMTIDGVSFDTLKNIRACIEREKDRHEKQ